MAERIIGSHPFGSFKKRNGIFTVLFDSCRNRKNIEVKNDVLWWESHFLCQNLITAFRNFNSSWCRICLSGFIECHHNNSSTVFTDGTCLFNEFFLPSFQRDGIDNGFSLNAFQTRFDDFPFRGIDHNRNP